MRRLRAIGDRVPPASGVSKLGGGRAAGWRTGAVVLGRWAGTVAFCGLAGCAAPPVEPTDAPPAALPVRPADRALADYEQRLTDRAQAATAQKRWGEAALAWELLDLLRPDDAALRERLADARARARAAAAEQSARAAQAAQRGDPDAAAQRWLAALALDPGDATAANALRQLEAERNRKTLLGRHAGTVLTRRALAEAEAMPDDVPADAGAGGPEAKTAPRRAVARTRAPARPASAVAAGVGAGTDTRTGPGAVAGRNGGSAAVATTTSTTTTATPPTTTPTTVTTAPKPR